MVLSCRLVLTVTLSSEMKLLVPPTPILLPAIAPMLHDPEVPGAKANWL